MSAKLRLKYNVEKHCPAFFVGSKFQVSKDGKELLCDNITNIAIVDVSTGQAAKKSSSQSGDANSKEVVALHQEEDEEGPEDAFKNARIEMDEADGVTAFKLSPDGSRLILATKNLLLKLYSWPERTLLKQFRSYHRAHITCLDWDLSSTLVVSGSTDQTARVWDTRRSCSTHSLRDAGGVFGCVTFHPNLQKRPYVYAGVMSVLCVWRLSAGSSELVHKFDSAHFMNITCVEATRDGKHIVSCGLDRVTILWQAAPMQQLKVVMVGQAVGGAVILPKGPDDVPEAVSVVLGGETGHLSIWRVDLGKEMFRTTKPLVEPIAGDNRGNLCITGLVHCPALQSVVVSSYDNNILFVETEQLKLWKMFCGYNEQVLATVFVSTPPMKKEESSEDQVAQESLLAVATNSPQLRVYRTVDMSCRLLHGHSDGVLALAKHPHLSDVFASSSRDQTVRVWRCTYDFSAVCVAVASGHSHRVATIALGMDMLISGSKDTCIKRWLLSEEKLTIVKKELLEDQKKKKKTSTNPDVKKELLSSTNAMTPNSLMCGATQVGHEKDINCISVSPKDRLIATASEDRSIKIWSGQNLALEGTLRGHKRGVWSVQFSPVDKLLASSSADGSIGLWLLESLTLAKTLSGHECGVLNVAWLNKGLQLVSTSASGIVKIWEVKTSTCLDTLSAHDEQRVWALDVMQDGELVVTGGEDSKIILWRDVTQTVLLQQAQEKQRIYSEEQTLANLMREQRWAEALVYALKLDQPFNCLKVIRGLLKASGRLGLGKVLVSLEPHQLGALIKFVAKWNTRAATCTYAQEIVYLLLSTRTPEELDEVPFWTSSLAALSSYSSRHYTRAAALHQSSGILDYCASLVSMTRAIEQIDITHGLGAEEEEDEIDDQAMLNLLQPIKPEENDRDKDSSSESSDSEDQDGSFKSAHSDSDESMASDDDNKSSSRKAEVKTKKKKKTSKTETVEDLDAGYVQEEPIHSEGEEEDEEGEEEGSEIANSDVSMDDEGVGSEDDEGEGTDGDYAGSDDEFKRGMSRGRGQTNYSRSGSRGGDRGGRFSRGGLDGDRGRGGFGRGRGGFGGDRGRGGFGGGRGRGGFGGDRGRGGFGGVGVDLVKIGVEVGLVEVEAGVDLVEIEAGVDLVEIEAGVDLEEVEVDLEGAEDEDIVAGVPAMRDPP
ncbi:Small-subunit processome Utp13 [Trinorchestia longiramus]|nr:Small-subunit processome Utp13 [Trinorchestia longiramus]